MLHLRLTKEYIAQTDRNSLGLDIVVQSSLSKLTPNTRLFVATEWEGPANRVNYDLIEEKLDNIPVKGVVCVDPNGTSLECVSNLESCIQILCVNSSGEAVCGIVSNLDDLSLVLELGDCADGAEDLFTLDLHVLVDVGEDGGLNEVALVTLAFATSLDSGTLLLTLLDVAATC